MKSAFTGRLGVLIIVLVIASACGGGSAPQGKAIQAADAWARAAGVGANVTSAAYLTLRNPGSAADRLVQVQCDAANAVELHKTEIKDNVMKMAPVEGGIEIPAGGEVQLKPGGLHIMLIGVQRELKAGEKLTLKLQFEKTGALTVEAEIRNP